jgi:hypothetical protein
MRINDPNLLQQVVNYLDQHQESVRIKKMLYCLCTGRWEKDTDYLSSINFQYLIEQIVRENNTLELLRALLQSLIGTVNKPKQYIAVAKIIYLAIGQLYPEFNQQHGNRSKPAPAKAEAAPISSVTASYPELPNPTTGATSSVKRAYAPEPTQSDQGVPSSVQRAYAPEPTQSDLGVPSSLQRAYAPEPTQLTDQGVPSSLQRAYSPLATQQFETQPPIEDNVDESAYETYYAPDLAEEDHYNQAAAYDDRPDDRPIVPEYDAFVLRQNVMSYANPLRAKIILLLMLRPDFNFSSQSVSMMREYQLDDLLLEVLKAYPTMPELEESMAYSIEQLVEIEEYGKAASGLIQSLMPIYSSKKSFTN